MISSKKVDKRSEREFSRVYFFGAGASCPLGYPSGSQLPIKLIRYLKGRTGSNKRHAEKLLNLLSEMLNDYFGIKIDLAKDDIGVIRKAMHGKVSIAEFYSVADTLSNSGLFTQSRQNGGDEPTIAEVYPYLAAATRGWFLSLTGRKICEVQFVPELKALLTDIARHNRRYAVVSFNWDEELDFEFCTENDKDVCYTLGDWHTHTSEGEHRVLLLKPHGSIGWYDVQNGISNDESYFVADRDSRIDRSRKRIMAFNELEMPRGLGTEGYLGPHVCPPTLTSPTFVKRFDFEEQKIVWRDVEHVCRTASEFVFIGYSMPPDDFLTIGALSRAVKRKATAKPLRWLAIGKFDGDSHITANFTRCFGASSQGGAHYMNYEFMNTKRRANRGLRIGEKRRQEIAKKFQRSFALKLKKAVMDAK